MDTQTRSENELAPLGNRELSIMNVIWDLGEATVHDVLERLPDDLAYTTVLTMMRHLESKGYLRHRTSGRQYVYYPLVDRKQVQRRTVLDVLTRLFGGASNELISTVLESTELSREDIDELRKMLAQLEKHEGQDR